MKILANDGIDNGGKKALEEAGFTVITEKVSQENLAEQINEQGFVGLLVRSATTARKDLIDSCPGLKFIGRGGVGIDNIDKAYAESKGIVVFNTPAASSQSVAELVISMMFAAARSIYDAGGNMPGKGSSDFETLKKKYSKGIELRGKTLGIIGFGRIGRSLASYALGCGMKVIACDSSCKDPVVNIELDIFGCNEKVKANVPIVGMEEVFSSSDFISLHVPKQADGSAVIGKEQFTKMKKGVVLINTSRGGIIDEQELIQQLNAGHVRMACLDVFVGEPKPIQELLQHPQVISTPHIGASTEEAQNRIGLEIAENVRRITGK